MTTSTGSQATPSSSPVFQPNTATELVRAARLKFLPRLLLHGPPVLVALLSHGDAACMRDWKGRLVDDLRWLRGHTDGELQGDGEELLQSACAAACASKHTWQRAVRRALETARLGRRNLVEAQLGDEVIRRAALAAGVPWDAPSPQDVRAGVREAARPRPCP